MPAAGRDVFQKHLPNAHGVTEATLAPLTGPERARLLRLLSRLR